MFGIARITQGRPKPTKLEENWLQKALDEHLSKGVMKKDAGVFHASSLGNPCDRYLYYHYRGLLHTPISAQLQRIFDNGNSAHGRYLGYFTKMGILVSSEIPMKIGNPPISGRADFIIKLPTVSKCIIEAKTINNHGFTALTKAKEEHIIQLQVYLNGLGISFGMVLYENKDTQALKVFNQERDMVVWEKIIERCRGVMVLAEPPPIKENHDKYCDCLGVKI